MSRTPDLDPAAWRRIARRELRRARRYAQSLVGDLSDEDLLHVPTGADSTACIQWHLGRIAVRERQHLSTVLATVPWDGSRDLPFVGEPIAPVDLPSLEVIRASASAARQLTESLVENADSTDLSEMVLAIVNDEYAEAAAINRLRHEIGRPVVDEPRGELIGVDTDGENSPRFFLDGWQRPTRRRRLAEVVELSEFRSRRAGRTVELGIELVALGDYRGALRLFEESEGLERTAESLTYQGWMHSLLGDVERAEQLCLAAIEVDPDFGNPYNDIGTLCLQRRDVHAAIEWFGRAKRARRYEPRHYPFLNLGRLYMSLGMPEKALREFEGALAVAPDNTEARLATERLRRQLEEEAE